MANQAYRSRVRQMLSMSVQVAEEQGEDLPKDPARRKRPVIVGRGWGTAPLGISVQVRTSRRIRHQMWRFFESPYDPAVHRGSFAGLLRYMSGRVRPSGGESSWDKFLAWDFAALLGLGPLPHGNHSRAVLTLGHYQWTDKRAAATDWMRAFLADQPAWEPRLREWVESMAGEPLSDR